MFHSDFKSECRLLLSTRYDPAHLLPCPCPADTSRSSHWRGELAPCPPLAHPWPRNANSAQRKSWKWGIRDDISPSQQQPGLTLTFCKSTDFRKGRDKKKPKKPEMTIWLRIPTYILVCASFTCTGCTESHLSISESDCPVIAFSVLVTHFKENIQPGLRDCKFSNQEIVKMKAPFEHLGEGKGGSRESIKRNFLFIFSWTSCPLTEYMIYLMPV